MLVFLFIWVTFIICFSSINSSQIELIIPNVSSYKLVKDLFENKKKSTATFKSEKYEEKNKLISSQN